MPTRELPHFDEALAALDAGDVDRLRELLRAHPDLVKARTNLDPPYHYFSGATLLHHVAGNPYRDGVSLPKNVVDIARLLLAAGSDPNAETLGRNGSSTIGLVITGRQASEANVSGPLIDVLLEYGARLVLDDVTAVVPEWDKLNILDLPLANGAPRAAEKLIELGAKVDVCAAAALGRMDLLRACFDTSGELIKPRIRDGKPMSDRDSIGLALLFAYVNKHPEAVDFLIEKDGNWNMTGVNNGTALHRATWDGDLDMVKRLVAKGADISNRDNPFVATPYSWAQHNKQDAVQAWMRANCRIDIHDAVGFGIRDHVEARLREDPSSVNKQIDQWDIPRSTPLHWAVWPALHDVDGAHPHDLASRVELIEFLVDRGADPNIAAGNGCTVLDVAIAGGAEQVIDVVRRRGGRRARDL